MRHAHLRTVLVALLVVLAGCSAGVTDGPADVPATGDGPGDGTDGDRAGDTGTVRFYVSDRPAAIEEFRHLNVTVTAVGFHRVGGTDGAGDGEDDADETTASTTAANGTAGNTTTANESTTNATTASTTTEAGEGDEGKGDDGEIDGSWTTYQVDNVTVDLTRLVGANATRIADLAVPNGTYDAVFVYVSEVNATLEDGSSVRVKLPSHKLQIKQRFSVDANRSVDFVFDVAVHRAGNSGKYVLKPVISESGTDVPVEEVGDETDDSDGEADDGEDEPDDEGGTDEAGNETEARGEGNATREDGEKRAGGNDRGPGDADGAGGLNATVAGEVTPGGSATLSVARNGSAVAGATVAVNGEVVGETGADGTLRFSVPPGNELTVTVTKGEAEAELEFTFEQGRDGDRGGNPSVAPPPG